MSQNSFGFNKALVLFCLGVIVIIGAAIIATMPPSGSVEARERTFGAPPCHTESIALDEGYGVSRVVMRRVCEDF